MYIVLVVLVHIVLLLSKYISARIVLEFIRCQNILQYWLNMCVLVNFEDIFKEEGVGSKANGIYVYMC